MAKTNVAIAYSFDADTASAVKVAKRHAAKRVTAITRETENAIRGAVTKALQKGIPPYDAANVIKSIIGLTSSQSSAVFSYRERLIDNGLSIDTVNHEVDKYADKLLGVRARSIARTEVMDALNEGQVQSWKEAVREGVLPEDAQKEWITADPCDDCAQYDGKTVPLDEEFEEGDPPLHPNCRCTLGIAAEAAN